MTFLPMNPFASEAEWPRYISPFSDVITNQCLNFKIYINQLTRLMIKPIGSFVEGYQKFKFQLLTMSGLWYFWGGCPLHSPFAIRSVRYAKRRTAWKIQISVKEWFFSKKKSLVKFFDEIAWIDFHFAKLKIAVFMNSALHFTSCAMLLNFNGKLIFQ